MARPTGHNKLGTENYVKSFTIDDDYDYYDDNILVAFVALCTKHKKLLYSVGVTIYPLLHLSSLNSCCNYQRSKAYCTQSTVQISSIRALIILEELRTGGKIRRRESGLGYHKEGCGDDDDILSAARDGLDPYHSLLFIQLSQI